MIDCAKVLSWNLEKILPVTAWTAGVLVGCHHGEMSQHLAAHRVKRSDEVDFFVVARSLNSHAGYRLSLAQCHFQAAKGGSAVKAPMMSAGPCGEVLALRRLRRWPAPYCEALQQGRRASGRIGGEGDGRVERRRL